MGEGGRFNLKIQRKPLVRCLSQNICFLFFFKRSSCYWPKSMAGFEPLWLASDLSTCQSYAQALLICGVRKLQADGTLAVLFLGDPLQRGMS